ncbi:hypothetical protein SANTM175S_08101 [Streptomyces antimycoticus]
MKWERLPALELADRAQAAPSDRAAMVPFRGVPMIPMPEHVVEAARTAASEVFPRRSRGSAELRRAIASRLEAVHGLAVDPESELLITHGAQHGMSVALRALLSPGDEVVVPAPSYFFDGMIRLAGARPVYVPSDESRGWDHVPAPVEGRGHSRRPGAADLQPQQSDRLCAQPGAAVSASGCRRAPRSDRLLRRVLRAVWDGARLCAADAAARSPSGPGSPSPASVRTTPSPAGGSDMCTRPPTCWSRYTVPSNTNRASTSGTWPRPRRMPS